MLALVLDRTHAVLLEDGLPLTFSHDGTERPLRSLTERAASRGIALPSPAGSRACAGGGRDFVFVVDRFEAPPRMAWKPLADASASDELWELYVACMLGGWRPPARDVDVWSFGDRPEMMSQLAHLVACGEKRVTVGWVDAARHSGTPLAREGGVSVVTDGFGYPRLVLRTAHVREQAFDEIDAATAAGEGEGDLSYGDWRDGHVGYFTAEAARYGLAFTGDARISVERFEVLHVVGRADDA